MKFVSEYSDNMMIRLLFAVLIFILNSITYIQACGGCSTCKLSDSACVPTEVKTRQIPFSTGWWFTKRTGYKTVTTYYKGRPYCCGGYVLDGFTCNTAAMNCGGCDLTGTDSEQACVQSVQQKISRRSVISYKCNAWWWTVKTCYRTNIYYTLSRKEIRSCCSGYILNGDTCIKDNSPKTCGKSKYPSPGIRQIVGGNTAQPNEFPWQVRLIMNENGICGGTLIGSRWVLTAAHCAKQYADNPGRITIIGGDHLYQTPESTEQTSLPFYFHRYAISIFVHADYNTKTFDNDIALIRLNSPFTINDDVRPACLPEKCDEEYIDKRVIISGWGRTSKGNIYTQKCIS
ncbi:hypothetical protein LSH36_45g00015 [Paralvinella palmiformis]|uniref:Peptidase S1 domain-containing protein n=1 Tax=Paralvinella palmiformis TaxID=53620 RepID=A0AAD9NCZ5_9ANNE|nr:hypothetical protein LSH36_45g00015 [Paralvinella palmiformis]